MRSTIPIVPLVALLLAAQPASLGAQPPTLVFKHLSIEQGLSESIVNEIGQDRHGFMWFVTEDGLNLFDGYSFEVFKHDAADPTSLSHNEIKCIFEDREGIIWIGTFYRGLERFDPAAKRFTHFQHDPRDPLSISNDIVWAVLEDRESRLWVGTGGGGLNLMDRAKGTFAAFRSDPADPATLGSDDVRVLHQDKAGMLWIGTAGGGLNRMDPATRRITRYRNEPADPRSLSNDDVRAIAEDGDGAIWVGTNGGGLNRLDPSTGFFERFRHDPGDVRTLGADSVLALVIDGNGTLWAGTDGGGLNRFDRSRRSFDRFVHEANRPTSLASDRVWSLHADRSGVLWVGTYGSGVSRTNLGAKPFVHYRHDTDNPNSLGHDIVWSFCEQPAGILWVGTNDGGLNRLDRATGRWTSYVHDPADPRSIAHNSVRMVVSDRSGWLWIATNGGGLDRFDPARGIFLHHRHDPRDPRSLARDELRTVFEDRQGTIWVGTYGGGLDRWDPETGGFVHYRSIPSDPRTISNDYVRVAFEDASGGLWFGTHGGGLNRFDRSTGEFTRFRSDPLVPGTLSNDFVFSIHEDRRGTLWVGTYGGGLNRFDRETGTFEAIRKSDGLPDDVVYGILEDSEGRLWVSSNSGIARLDPGTGAVRGYTLADGLQSNEFNGGAYYRNRRGEMFFGGVNGFNVFDPAAIREAGFKAPIVLTDFRLFDRPVPVGPLPDGRVLLSRAIWSTERIELSHEDRVVSFQFAALDFASPDKNRYAYKLEGLDAEWTDVGTRRFVMYTTLPPGRYVLRVKGTNSDGIWNEDGASLAILVHPPWWRTGWAYAAYAALLAGTMAALTFFAKLREREKGRLVEAELRARAAELQTRTAVAEAAVLRLENERKTLELEQARKLQLSMLPARLPDHPLYRVAARMRTATEVGGDYYDFHAATDGTLTLAVGDATGHGTRAGIMVAMMKALFARMSAERDIAAFMDECHATLRGLALSQMYMALGLLRFEGRECHAVGAAMPPVLVFRSATGGVEQVPMVGMLLGADFDLPRGENRFTLEPGDQMLIMSDGYAEQFDSSGEMMDYDRTAASFGSVAGSSPEAVIEHMLRELDSFRGPVAQGDDVTLVVVEARG
ncbi:MAG: two-component regulator propeller domain-containing protein [Vicinamibacterales bacterium]